MKNSSDINEKEESYKIAIPSICILSSYLSHTVPTDRRSVLVVEENMFII